MSILDKFRVTDRVALVTGAGKGIGAATALALADAGADVAVVARTADDVEAVAKEVRSRGRRALAMPADVNDLDRLPELVARTVDELGGLDILVNNAGGSMSHPFLDTRATQLESSFHFNVSARFELSRHAVPAMLARGGGSIVNIGSMAGVHAARGLLTHSVMKAAINHMTEVMANDLAPLIRVNAVLPGAVETESLRWWLDQQGPDLRAGMHSRTLTRRNGEPEDIAAAVLYLASDAASWVTGKLLQVDGGFGFELVPSALPDLTS